VIKEKRETLVKKGLMVLEDGVLKEEKEKEVVD
jgi:hypothetical protein